MKKFIRMITIMAAAFTMLFAGCKTVPTVETLETTSLAVGKAAGMVANQTKIDGRSRQLVIEIMSRAGQFTPEKGQSFTAAWTPIADKVIAGLVADGSLDKAEGELVKGAFTVVCQGLDYLVSVRYPKVREYEELTAAAVRGFTSGFLSVFTDMRMMSSASEVGYDVEAYEYLMALGAMD